MAARTTTKKERLKASGALNPHPEEVISPTFVNDTFFDPQDLIQVKYEMLRMARMEGLTKSDAAAQFGLSRPTYYQAERAYADGGLTGLLPRQRGPKQAHKLTDQILQFIEEQRAENEPLRARELARRIEQKFNTSIHPRSIERAISKKKKRQGV